MYLNLSQTVNILRVGVDNVSVRCKYSADATPNLEQGNVSTAFLLN